MLTTFVTFVISSNIGHFNTKRQLEEALPDPGVENKNKVGHPQREEVIAVGQCMQKDERQSGVGFVDVEAGLKQPSSIKELLSHSAAGRINGVF